MCLVFLHLRPVTSLHRVDVTEVQISIIIMYLMTAFGGVSLWQIAVIDSYVLMHPKDGRTLCTHTHTHTYSNTFIHPECLVHAKLIILLAFSCPSSL